MSLSKLLNKLQENSYMIWTKLFELTLVSLTTVVSVLAWLFLLEFYMTPGPDQLKYGYLFCLFWWPVVLWELIKKTKI